MGQYLVVGLADTPEDHPDIHVEQGGQRAGLPNLTPCGAVTGFATRLGSDPYTTVLSWDGIETTNAAGDPAPVPTGIEIQYFGSGNMRDFSGRPEWSVTIDMQAGEALIDFGSLQSRRFWIRAVSDNGLPGPWTETIIVKSSPHPPTVYPDKTVEPLLYAVGVPIRFSILSDTLMRGEDMRYDLHSGSLPPGTTLTDRGSHEGTPTQGGTYNPVIRAYNDAGEVLLTFPMTVEADASELPRSDDLVISRTSLVLPGTVYCAVKLTGWGVGDHRAHRRHIAGQARWDMGSPGQTHLDPTGRLAAYGQADANVTFGAEVGHTYCVEQTTPGTKTISVTVRHGGVAKTRDVDIECVHPDAHFPDTKVIYASTSGNFPAGATLTYTGTSVREALALASGDRRLRLRGGEDFDDSEGLFDAAADAGVTALIDSYGTGQASVQRLKIGGGSFKAYDQVSAHNIRTRTTFDARTCEMVLGGDSGLNISDVVGGDVTFSRLTVGGARRASDAAPAKRAISPTTTV